MSLFSSERLMNDVRTSADYLLDRMIAALPSVAVAICILFVFWLLARLVRRLVSVDRNLMRHSLIRQSCYYAVLAIGVFVALGVIGIDVGALFTGLGLGGVALGFALKDILSNLVSGVLMLMTDTFEIGDQIVVGETEGTVERIEVRTTHVRTYDGRLVLVPNGEVFSARVTNNTASPLRRSSVFVYLDYQQDLELALAVILQAAKGVAGVASHPAASIRLRDLTPECFRIEARIWTESRRTDLMATSSAARIAIVAALLEAGVELPNPDSVVRIEEQVIHPEK